MPALLLLLDEVELLLAAVALLLEERAVLLLYLDELPLEVFRFDLPLSAVLPLLRPIEFVL